MITAKQEVRRLLDEIADDATFEDIQYHIYVREKIERGLKDVEEGRVVSEEEMDRRMQNLCGARFSVALACRCRLQPTVPRRARSSKARGSPIVARFVGTGPCRS
jgi:predicted transcriptional regulator